MAAARDQAARILRPDLDRPDEAARDGAPASAEAVAESIRPHVPKRPLRRPAETPTPPAIDKPARAAANRAAAKSGKRKKLVLMGVGLLLALAAASYGVH